MKRWHALLLVPALAASTGWAQPSPSSAPDRAEASRSETAAPRSRLPFGLSRRTPATFPSPFTVDPSIKSPSSAPAPSSESRVSAKSSASDGRGKTVKPSAPSALRANVRDDDGSDDSRRTTTSGNSDQARKTSVISPVVSEDVQEVRVVPASTGMSDSIRRRIAGRRTFTASQASSELVSLSREGGRVPSTDFAVAAAESVNNISNGLQAGCSTLDPGCKLQVSLIRRTLESASSLFTEGVEEQDSGKLRMGMERMDEARRYLDELAD